MRRARIFTSALTLLTALALPANAQSYPDGSRVLCGGLYDLCGLIDPATGDEVFPQTYERIFGFSEGLSAVRVEGRSGYIDETGKLVIPPAFDLAGPFTFGLAEVVVGIKAGIIDTTGAWVVEPRFAYARPISTDVLEALETEALDPDSELDRSNPNWLSLPGRAVYGLFHIKSGWITDRKYRFSLFNPDAPGLIWATQDDGSEPLWGLMRVDGTWQIAPSFDLVQGVHDGMAIVRRKQPSATSFLHFQSGALDAAGRLVIPLRPGWIGYFRNGVAPIGDHGGHVNGMIDKQGNLVGGRLFDETTWADKAGVELRVRIGVDWFDLRADGSLTPYVAPPPGEVPPFADPQPANLADLECAGGAWLTRQGDLWGMTDPDGDWIIPPLYQAIDCFQEGVVWVPIVEEKRWCPLGPDGARQDHVACRAVYAPLMLDHAFPERINPDQFTNWLLWNRAYLANCENPASPPPRVCGDGGMGGTGCSAQRCRSLP